MKKSLLLTALLVSLPCFAGASSKDAGYVELLGSGVYPSINYERLIDEDYALRLGAGYYTSKHWSIPTGVYRLLGTNQHKLEVGVGLTYLKQVTEERTVYIETSNGRYVSSYSETSKSSLNFVPSIGYRYMPLSNGIIFRSGFTPLVSEGRLAPLVGVSLGYRF